MNNSLNDPIKDIWNTQPSMLDKIFKPKTVAVIGATEKHGSVGRTVLSNLIKNQFGGTVYPVNPKRSSVLGIRAYSNVAAVPEKIELAVIVTPAGLVPGVLKECSEINIPAAVVISAGFKEMGVEGEKLEAEIKAIISESGMRIIGPNCLGVMNPINGLNATFAAQMASPGKIAFISQSGALCTAVLDWSERERVGFSSFVSIGSMLDVNWGDLIDYFGNDPHTESIIIYMESIGNARAFLSAAREVALSKPIIVIKAGRTDAAAKAAASHTGSLTGSDDVLDEAFKRAGVLRVNEISELFDMSEVLGKQPLPKGPNLTILTNAGGPGVLATDALILADGKLTDLSTHTFSELNAFLPAHWSRNNPIDILGDAAPERYAKALEIAANDPNSNGLLVILTPQDMTDPVGTAKLLSRYAKIPDKPLLASWMGGPLVSEAIDILNQAGIPTFAYPDRATKAFMHMWKYSDNLSRIYQIPILQESLNDGINAKAYAEEIISCALNSKRYILTETESKNILSAYGIPVVPNLIANTPDDAANSAEQLGFPVVLKLHSETITHKSDVGGVKLNLIDRNAVVQAYNEIKESVSRIAGPENFQGVAVAPMIKAEGYEIILGSSRDIQFGPVMLFGLGGQLVEVFKDRALAIPPLNSVLASRLMESTKIFTALKGVRGKAPANIAKLNDLLVRFSQMIVELSLVKECDINPLRVCGEEILALDARFVLHNSENEDITPPAIRPYPQQYKTNYQLKDGLQIRVRPIKPEDLPDVSEFHKKLSLQTIRSRYNAELDLEYRISPERLRRICFVDYERELALLVKSESSREIIAIGRLSKSRSNKTSKFSLMIADTFQNRGIGKKLVEHLVSIARQENLESVEGLYLAENNSMQKICAELGFKITDEKEGLRRAILTF